MIPAVVRERNEVIWKWLGWSEGVLYWWGPNDTSCPFCGGRGFYYVDVPEDAKRESEVM